MQKVLPADGRAHPHLGDESNDIRMTPQEWQPPQDTRCERERQFSSRLSESFPNTEDEAINQLSSALATVVKENEDTKNLILALLSIDPNEG